jgi:hypothetical protein
MGGVQRDAVALILNENRDLLGIKYSKLHGQTKERDLLVFFKPQNV